MARAGEAVEREQVKARRVAEKRRDNPTGVLDEQPDPEAEGEGRALE